MQDHPSRMTSGSGRLFAVACIVAVLLGGVSARAVQPQRWLDTTEADFEPGEARNVLVTNLGDLKLAALTQTVGKLPAEVSLIFDMQALGDGTLILAGGPEGRLLRRKGDEVNVLVTLAGEQVYALAKTREGKALAGISGAPSRLAVLDGEQLQDVAVLPGVRYIWDLLVVDQTVYVATGTEGKLLRVDLDQLVAQPAAAQKDAKAAEAAPEEGRDQAEDQPRDEAKAGVAEQLIGPKVTELLDARQSNLLCLGRDGKGRLYVGTDTDGLVYRVEQDAAGPARSFVIYDAAEPEIGALVVQEDGTVYAGTADANQARPGRLEKPASAQAGRPEDGGAKAKGDPGKPAEPKDPAPRPPVPPAPEPMPAPAEPEGAPAATPAPAVEAAPTPDTGAGVEPEAVVIDLTAGRALPAPLAGEQPPATSPSKPATPPSAQPAVPTAQQYDQLRQTIRDRLMQARQGGQLQASPQQPSARPPAAAAAAAAPRTTRSRGTAAPKQGNAVYRIAPDGFVQEVFRESVMILHLLLRDGKLIVATGNEGGIYQVDPVAEETTRLVDLEPKQIPAMLEGPEGEILLGTANPGTLVRLQTGYAREGTFTSKVQDAQQVSLWGALRLIADIPANTRVKVETRSGNVENPDHAPWSDWAAAETFEPSEKVAPHTPRETKVTSPPARFLQYRLTLSGDGKSTAVVDEVEVSYAMPNLKPEIKSLKAAYPDQARAGRPGGKPEDEPNPQTKLKVEWEAGDPNDDTLLFDLEYRIPPSDKWIRLAKDLRQNQFEWETRRVPDGRYILRVTASDRRDNPLNAARTASRQSDPVLVDNTSPQFEQLKGAARGNAVVIAGKVIDALSPITEVHYTVDATDKWQAVLPRDGIFDSTSEELLVTIAGLSVGQHVVTLRAVDDRGNSAYRAVLVEISQKPRGEDEP